MKQIVLRDGKIDIHEQPIPTVDEKSILVRTAYSFISSGTERAALQEQNQSLFAKIVSNPRKLKRAFQKFQDSGLRSPSTTAMSHNKVEGGLGYSCVGVVEKVGEAVLGFQSGDIVACAGAGRANHAEMVSIPVNLAIKVPVGCPVKYAATVATGAIASAGSPTQ